MVSSTMMMILIACGATTTSEHNDWLKLHRSNPLSPISLIFGVRHRVIGDEAGTSNAIDLAKDWLLEKGVDASEIVAVEESFIEVNVAIGVAEGLVGAIYYDYQSAKDGNTIIQRINDEDEFVIPQSAVHFLDYVWPTVLREEEVIMEEVAREEAEAEEEEEGYYYRRLLDTDGCATGYYARSGDIPGNGIGGLRQVSNCNECAQLCSDNGNCLSYECSPTELKCNLNTVANPTAPAYKDYAFCTKKICAYGYHAQIGDIPGWGTVLGVGGGQQVSNCDECARLCSAGYKKNIALSYECSPTELKCNCNTGANPTADAYKDYVFCTKNNIRTEESCSKSITATSEEHCAQTWEYYCPDGYFEEEGRCRKWVFLPFPIKVFGSMLRRLIPGTCTFKVERIDCPCCSRASEPCNCPHELTIRSAINPFLRQCHHYFDKQSCASTDTDWIHSQLSDFLQS